MGGGSETPPAQRVRTKAPDFSELFRSAQGIGSRHASRAGGSSPSLALSQGDKDKDKLAVSKAPSRRSMIPFLGRKKPVEASPAVAVSRKSVGASQPMTPVNTVRRSFGNGHAVFMITPSPNYVPAVPGLPRLPTVPIQPPVPAKPAPVEHPLTLGSKLAAHFTPLRSPSRNSKARRSMIYQPDEPTPPLPPSTLSPYVSEIRAPSVESQQSMRSRSTTPRPLRGPVSASVENGDEEDFSDLFTRPDQSKNPAMFQSPQTPSTTSVHMHLDESPSQSGERSPLTPLDAPLHFPIPPSTIGARTERALPCYSSERASLSSQGSKSPSKILSSSGVDSASVRMPFSDLSSQDERRSRHGRTTSVSGSDTDTSRANESMYSASSFKLATAPKPPRVKHKLSGSSVAKGSSGPPPSAPLPSPPLSPGSAGMVPRSGPSTPPHRVAFPRPRANTLSVTTNLAVPSHAVPKSSQSSPPRSARANSTTAAPEATIGDLQEALSQQCRKNAQLQEYICTITKRYEDDRIAMTRTIEKLERNIRKKMREIEGLRWLVIHHGAVSDIDAAANLARSSLSTHEGEQAGDSGVQRASPLSLSSPDSPSTSKRKGAGTHATSPAEQRPDTSISMTGSVSTSPSDTSLTTAPSLSVIPERIDGISRSERQRLKEERRASKALRRISVASSGFAMGPEVIEGPLDPAFDPKQHMDDVLEKLQPFRHV